MIDFFHSSGVLLSLNAALQIWCISLTTGSPYFIISPTMPSLPGLLLFFKRCTAFLTSSSSISMSASSLGGVIVPNSLITCSLTSLFSCTWYSSLQYSVHLCRILSVFISSLPKLSLTIAALGCHFLLMSLIILYTSLVLNSAWYISISLHCLSNHFSLSALAAFRTSLHFFLYSSSAATDFSLVALSCLFSWTSFSVSDVIHFLFIFSCSGIVCSTASIIPAVSLFALMFRSSSSSNFSMIFPIAVWYAVLVCSSPSFAISLLPFRGILRFFFSFILKFAISKL